MRLNQKGFTLIELLLCLAIGLIVTSLVLGLTTLIRGNFWYTEESVLKALRSENPKIEEVTTVRNVWDYSEVTAKEGDVYIIRYLDSNILWNYTFHNSPQG